MLDYAEKVNVLSKEWEIERTTCEASMKNLETAFSEAQAKYNKKFERVRSKRLTVKTFLEDGQEIADLQAAAHKRSLSVRDEREAKR